MKTYDYGFEIPELADLGRPAVLFRGHVERSVRSPPFEDVIRETDRLAVPLVPSSLDDPLVLAARIAHPLDQVRLLRRVLRQNLFIDDLSIERAIVLAIQTNS